MDEFYKQDVFFFVTTIAVVLLTIVLTIAGIYFVIILKDLKYIARKVKTETDNLAADLEELKENVRQGGAKVRNVWQFLANVLTKREKK